MFDELENYLQVQNCALRALRDIVPFIRPGVTERNIAAEAVRLLAQYGIEDCWYHNVPAFVLAGKRTTDSMSGKDYEPSDLMIQENDLVTIDLSPRLNGYWGDCARSYIARNSNETRDPDLTEGLIVEKKLHAVMQSIAHPAMTMHELHARMNAEIEQCGYQNLDFMSNLGHSIEKNIDVRRYIEMSNYTCLGDVLLFTFEPHIRKKGGRWGFKRENIYHFKGEKLIALGDSELLGAV